MPSRAGLRAKLSALPPEVFQPRWAGYATAKSAYTPHKSQAGPFYQYAQRQGERPEEYSFNAFLATRDGDEVEELAGGFPNGGMWRSSSMLIRHWAGTAQGHAT